MEGRDGRNGSLDDCNVRLPEKYKSTVYTSCTSGRYKYIAKFLMTKSLKFNIYIRALRGSGNSLHVIEFPCSYRNYSVW